MYELFLAWRYNRERVYAGEVRRLMLLLRDIIDIAQIYDEDPAKFYDRFLETINVEALRERGIIDPDALVQVPKYDRLSKGLSREDAELCALIMADFKSRELKVIYGMKSINSVYVKRNRMKTRLNKNMQQLINNKNM